MQEKRVKKQENHKNPKNFFICPDRETIKFALTARFLYLCAKINKSMADNSILIRLDGLKLKYEEIGQKLTDPEVIADVKQFVQLTKEYKELEPIIETSERFRTATANLAEAKDILANDKDEEMREMARMEIAELEPALVKMEEEIKLLLIPKDPQDDKKAGTDQDTYIKEYMQTARGQRFLNTCEKAKAFREKKEHISLRLSEIEYIHALASKNLWNGLTTLYDIAFKKGYNVARSETRKA